MNNAEKIITTDSWSMNTKTETNNYWETIINNELNKTIDNYISDNDVNEEYDLTGPRRDTLYVVIPITIVYISIFITGIIGNVSTCIVIARNKSMHTATNYYLFSLAISDLLLLISGLPPEIWLIWLKYPYVFGECFCIIRGLAAETSTNATVLTITAFTVERYVAICHPFLSHTMSKLARAVKLILAIWLIALSFAVPQALQFGLVETHGPESVMCMMKFIIFRHSFELSTFLFFIVPMTLITILYALIGLKLRKSNALKRVRGRSENSRVTAGSSRIDRQRTCAGRSSRRVLKMLVAVVVAFFICWAPFHVQRLIAIYGTNSEDHMSSKGPMEEFLYLLFTYLSGVLYYVSTTINPILYNIMSHKFREAFMETLSRGCLFRRFTVQREQRSYSSLSRSQQKAPATFGSKSIGNTGSVAVAQESTEYSGNSIRDESLRRISSFSGRDDNETCKNYDNQRWQENIMVREKMLPKEIPKKLKSTTTTTTTSVKVARDTTKKWWKLLNWLPGFKSFRVQQQLPYGQTGISDNIVLESNQLNEFSINLKTIKENENNLRLV
ncbi:pyrokinin-1 receptor-like isoform X2 [Leptopilina heterotoma]|uniref:pyrokinin-1 receptor-like isoform X2 n=1 Tax=Leptopilina heterotoma TaxID=63436 RepID=UPI001CA8EAFF|nr:pyrokinin-1 receptor-like isoform X2 [Leptopilina heterotoma]